MIFGIAAWTMYLVLAGVGISVTSALINPAAQEGDLNRQETLALRMVVGAFSLACISAALLMTVKTFTTVDLRSTYIDEFLATCQTASMIAVGLSFVYFCSQVVLRRGNNGRAYLIKRR